MGVESYRIGRPLALVALCWFSACAHADAGGQPGDHAGIVKVARGDVRVLRREQSSALHVGDRVFSNDRIFTATGAAIGITLRDDTLLSLGPDSNVALEQYNFNSHAGEGNVAVRVIKGTLRYVTGLIGKHAPEHQQVMTPTATIGIRGTDFIVEVADE